MSGYTQYYTSSDVTVFIENKDGTNVVMLDKLKGILFSESLSSGAVYGIGNPKHGFKNTGNVIINGYLEFNFIHPDYLKNTLLAVTKGTTQQKEIDIESSFETLTYDELQSAITSFNSQIEESKESLHGIQSFPENFNIRVVFNNGNLYHGDTSKGYLIRDVKITKSQLTSHTSMEGAIPISYGFLARDLVSKT